MATPTGPEIRARAMELYVSEKQGETEDPSIGGKLTTPEDYELRQGGYFERARNELMRESGNLSPEDKDRALQEKTRLMQELSEVREALGYKPRKKKPKVEALVQAAKAPESTVAAVGTVDVAARQELEEMPTPPVAISEEENLRAAAALPGRRERRQHFPGRRIPELVVEVPEVSPELEEEESLEGASALPIPVRPGRVERFPGRYIPELAAQKQPEPEVAAAPGTPKPPPAHKQLSRSLRGIFKSTGEKLLEYEREQRARDAENRALQRQEDRELQQFQREVKLAERKRIVLAKATARVERAAEQAREGYGTGGGPVGDLARALSRRISPTLYQSRQELEAEALPEAGDEPEISTSPYGAGFGRFPSHRYPTYRFPGSPKGTRRLHFNIGQPKGPQRPSNRPRIRTSWSFNAAVKAQARPPNYNKGRRPYSFDLVKPEDREIRQEITEAQSRLAE